MGLFKGTDQSDTWQGNYEGFTEAEMGCKCGCGGLPRHSFMVRLVKLRKAVRFIYKVPFPVTSGFRCKKHNARIYNETGEKDGPHPQGVAVDLAVDGIAALLIVVIGYTLGFRGFGLRQNNRQSRFIHVDCVERSKALLWTY